MAEARPKTYPPKRGRSNERQSKKAGNYELKLCTAYLYRRDGCNRGDMCNFLHICRKYIFKQCRSKDGTACCFSHDLQSSQSQALFQRKFGIDPPEGEMLNKFRNLLAAAIKNPPKGESIDETFKEQWEEERQLSQEKLKNFLQSLCDGNSSGQHPPNSTAPQSSLEKQPEICQFYLHGNCKFVGQMHKHRKFKHCSSLFQWQIKDGTSAIVRDFTKEHNDLVEKHYCDVRKREYIGEIIAGCGDNVMLYPKVRIEFGTDRFSAYDDENGMALNVRRLSTPSHVQVGGWRKAYSAHWIWYWQDNKSQIWTAYPDQDQGCDGGQSTCSAIERAFLDFKNKGGPSQFEVTLEQRKWSLNFSCMDQYSLSEALAPLQLVARRPKWNPLVEQQRQSDSAVETKTSHQIEPIEPAGRPAHSASAAPSSSSRAPPDKSRSPDQKESLYICPYFLRGRCRYEDNKFNHKRHLATPYHWQFLDAASAGSDWQDFTHAENDAIEKSFCDVSNSSCSYKSNLPNTPHTIDVHFDTNPMMGTTSDVQFRRLSTSSSILRSNWEKAFCTEWIWYWCDETGKWTIYSEQNAKGVKAGIDSATIEQKYLEFESKDGESEIEFTAGSQKYKLDFAAMHQTNVSYGTCKQVRRRPKFVPMAERKRLSREISEAAKVGVVVPTKWDNRGTQTDLKLVPLINSTSPEYIAVANLFKRTMANRATIICIERIQNLELWEDFSKMSERMKKKNQGKLVQQKQLFHGTTSRTYADAICRQNFDWRLSGSNVGTRYGKGSYFARDAKFAHSYTKEDSQSHRYIFVVQVLVGTYTTGDQTYIRPPPKDPYTPHGDMYDSCVNDIANPEIFVIFEKTQVYPEYLIKYQEKSQHQVVTSVTAGRSSSHLSTGSSLRQSTSAQISRSTVPSSSAHTYNAVSYLSNPPIPKPSPAPAAASTSTYLQPGSTNWRQSVSSATSSHLPAVTQPSATRSYTTSSYRQYPSPSSPKKEKSCIIQ